MQYKPKFILGCEFEQQLFYDLSQNEMNLSTSTPAVLVDSSQIQAKFERNLRKNKKNRFEGVDIGD